MCTLEFYEDERGDKPVLRWIREELTRTQRGALGQAMRHACGDRVVLLLGGYDEGADPSPRRQGEEISVARSRRARWRRRPDA